MNGYTAPGERQEIDIVVLGAGQAGLAVGYYLRRTSYTWRILMQKQRLEERGGMAGIHCTCFRLLSGVRCRAGQCRRASAIPQAAMR